MDGELTLKEAFAKIQNKECRRFDIHCRMMTPDGHKYNLHYSEELDDYPEMSIEDFIKETDNYGSFWLTVWGYQEDDVSMFQLIGDNGKPLKGSVGFQPA